MKQVFLLNANENAFQNYDDHRKTNQSDDAVIDSIFPFHIFLKPFQAGYSQPICFHSIVCMGLAKQICYH